MAHPEQQGEKSGDKSRVSLLAQGFDFLKRGWIERWRGCGDGLLQMARLSSADQDAAYFGPAERVLNGKLVERRAEAARF